MDFINAPIGKGLPVAQSLRPLIAIPTTAGTGSETTGTAILDITSRSFKTGIANRALKPILGIVVSPTLPSQFTWFQIEPYHRTLKTQNLVRPKCKSAPALMFCSIAWKATRRYRK
jgi:hypothetical protein